MSRYYLVLAVLALAVGGLIQAVSRFHMPLLEMAATIGVFLMGLVGSLAVSRQQMDRGRRRVEAALQSLGSEFLITDWAEGRGPAQAPEYLVVAPSGLVTVVTDPMPQSTWRRRADRRLRRAQARAQACADWVQSTAAVAGCAVPAPLPVVVLTRREASPGTAELTVPVVNPEDLAAWMQRLAAPEQLNAEERRRLTLCLRRAAAPQGHGTKAPAPAS